MAEATETAATEPTAEELQARVIELRQQQRRDSTSTGGADSARMISETMDEYFQPEERTLQCEGCTHPFTYTTWRGSPRVRRMCDQCIDRSNAARAEEERQALAEAQERQRVRREEQVLELLERAGANPAEHRHATLASFDVSESGYRPVQMCQRFIAEAAGAGRYDEVKGLYLWGGTGTGKTHLAVATMRQMLLDVTWNPGAIVYDHAAELVARIQATYGGKGDSMELLERRFDARLWILDDLGTERASDDVARHLTLIFTRRALRPTIVTSNIPPEQMEKERPELQRVVSRLGQRYFRSAEVKGRDRRFD